VRRILLIRHGETAGNAARIVQKPDIPLSPRGEAQADALARRLAGEGITQIFSSDLERAAATARRLRATTGAPIAFDPLLQERNFGDVRGTRYDQLGFDLFEPGYAPPNGETWEMFHARVDQAWARIRTMAAVTPGTLAVVTHGLVCRSIAARHVALAEGRAGAGEVGEHVGDHRGRAGALARQPAERHRAPGKLRAQPRPRRGRLRLPPKGEWPWPASSP
jgi:probable phosphoglycerate mutase